MQDRLVVRIVRLGGTAGSNVETAACIKRYSGQRRAVLK